MCNVVSFFMSLQVKCCGREYTFRDTVTVAYARRQSSPILLHFTAYDTDRKNYLTSLPVRATSNDQEELDVSFLRRGRPCGETSLIHCHNTAVNIDYDISDAAQYEVLDSLYVFFILNRYVALLKSLQILNVLSLQCLEVKPINP